MYLNGPPNKTMPPPAPQPRRHPDFAKDQQQYAPPPPPLPAPAPYGQQRPQIYGKDFQYNILLEMKLILWFIFKAGQIAISTGVNINPNLIWVRHHRSSGTSRWAIDQPYHITTRM